MSGFGAPLVGPPSRPPRVKHRGSRQEENILMNIINSADIGVHQTLTKLDLSQSFVLSKIKIWATL